MAIEQKRGCGYRKVGGLYLVSEGSGVPCDRLPYALTKCPTCSCGIKQSRGWTWVDVEKLVGGNHKISVAHGEPAVTPCGCNRGLCPFCHGVKDMGKTGLLWIGTQFYPTPAHFIAEGLSLGFSKRISAIPRGFEVGKTWVLLAHPKTIQQHLIGGVVVPEGQLPMLQDGETVEEKWLAGIFRVWRPSRIEKIINESDLKNTAEMEKLHRLGITPVPVPDDDPDHHGSVWDKAEDPVTGQLSLPEETVESVRGVS